MDAKVKARDAALAEKEKELAMGETHLKNKMKALSSMKRAMAMPEDTRKRESLVLMKMGDLITPIRRMGPGAKHRVKQLTALGFHMVNHLADVPNARYLWRKLLETLKKEKAVNFRMHHDVKTMKNVNCYVFANHLQAESVIMQMGLDNDQAEAEWVKEVLNATTL